MNSNEEQYEDRISNLPNSLIAQILSCLPTKYAVATSVLSKTWKSLWTSITSLEFDDELLICPQNQSSNPSLQRSFTSFVCRVLHSVQFVHKFRLICHHRYDVSHVTGWISDLLLHNVRELDLSILEHSILLPPDFFTCRTLEVLKVDTNCYMNVPNLVSLSSLKILHLNGIRFVDDDSINRFLLGCPVLEELDMTSCVGKNVTVINIAAPMLTSLIICNCLSWSYDTPALQCKIVLDTPALLYLTIDDCAAKGYSVENLCHLIQADINFSAETINPIFSEAITVLLRGISNVQFLHLSDHSMESIHRSDPQLPMFHKMASLELGAFPEVVGWKLLENSPRLGTLIFNEASREYPFLSKGNSRWIFW